MYGDSLGPRITQLWLNVYGKMAKATWASGEEIPGIHLNGRTIIYYFCLRKYSEISVYQIFYHAWIVNSNYILCYISQSKTSCCLPGPNKTSKRPMFNMIHFVITWWPSIPARTMFFFFTSRKGPLRWKRFWQSVSAGLLWKIITLFFRCLVHLCSVPGIANIEVIFFVIFQPVSMNQIIYALWKLHHGRHHSCLMHVSQHQLLLNIFRIISWIQVSPNTISIEEVDELLKVVCKHHLPSFCKDLCHFFITTKLHLQLIWHGIIRIIGQIEGDCLVQGKIAVDCGLCGIS